MKIAFLDTEVNDRNIGIWFSNETGKKVEWLSDKELLDCFKQEKPEFICGHNFIEFDKKELQKIAPEFYKKYLSKHQIPIIDTLALSCLLFPSKRTHKLEKPYKRNIDRELLKPPRNLPHEDAQNTAILFEHLHEKFNELPENLRTIYANLLREEELFKGYFSYSSKKNEKLEEKSHKDLLNLLKEKFKFIHFKKDDFKNFIKTPIEFSLAISFLDCLEKGRNQYFSSYILKKYSAVVRIFKKLVNNLEVIDEKYIENFAKYNFSFFKEFHSMQKEIVESAVLKNESILSVLPTGSGKTFVFQLPALIQAERFKDLSVVISPLRALMKDQVNNFNKINNSDDFSVEVISSFLSPNERREVLRKIYDGTVDILYLAPESLRVESTFNALKSRNITRFIIDEAHCFSMWGHDFRHDYYYIAQTIKDLEKSPHQEKIAVSCFTATAKPEVIEDIEKYFKRNIGNNFKLKKFISEKQRENLNYQMIRVEDEDEKFEKLVAILAQIANKKKEGKNVSTIIYLPQNASKCEKLRNQLIRESNKRGWNLNIEAFYAKLDEEIEGINEKRRDKNEILNDFIDNRIDIIIATTAFGMGIDKGNISRIIHYEPSDSIESYEQESGRGARDIKSCKSCDCIIFYNEYDIEKLFSRLKNNYLDYFEIKRLSEVLKDIASNKDSENKLYIPLKKLSQKMGKYDENSAPARVKTALLELENADILERQRYKTQVYASSFKIENSDILNIEKEMIDNKINTNQKLTYTEGKFLARYPLMLPILDYIKDKNIVNFEDLKATIGNYNEKNIRQALKALSDKKILSKENDIRIFADIDAAKEHMQLFLEFEEDTFFKIIQEGIENFGEKNKEFEINLRDFNDEKLKNINDNIFKNSQPTLNVLKFILKTWKTMLKAKDITFSIRIREYKCYFKENSLDTMKMLEKIIQAKKLLIPLILDRIAEYQKQQKITEIGTMEVVFPSYELFEKLKEIEEVKDFEEENDFDISKEDVDFLFKHLAEILDENFKITGGRLIYNRKECLFFKTKANGKSLKIEDEEPYSKEDYENNLQKYIQQKYANIHLLKLFFEKFEFEEGKKESINSKKALEFKKCYFKLHQKDFLKTYSEIDSNFLKKPISKSLYEKIHQDLNNEQRDILNDDQSQTIMILAGPGCGKTKTLVHKIASMLTEEGKKSENFLMLAHTRVAVREFRERLYELLGKAYPVKIRTFHAFALDLLAKNKSMYNNFDQIIKDATDELNTNNIVLPYIEMLVLDEYQDVNEYTDAFTWAIHKRMSGEKRIIAAADSDQCIFEFGGANSEFIEIFKNKSQCYNLIINYRSNATLLNFSNFYRKSFLQSNIEYTPSPENKEEGFISLTQHTNNLSYKHIAEEVKILKDSLTEQNQKKTIAILVRTNAEVEKLRYELQELNIETTCVLDDNELGFQLKNIIEFWEILNSENPDEYLYVTRNRIFKKYKNSVNLELVKKAFAIFEEEYGENNRNHLSFHLFMEELRYEELVDFQFPVVISTVHKVKGKEFDYVFVGMNKEKWTFDKDKDEDKRIFYVAFTRAKSKIFIHSNNFQFNNEIKDIAEIEYKEYDKKDDSAQKIVLAMGLSDIWLGYYVGQDRLDKLLKEQPEFTLTPEVDCIMSHQRNDTGSYNIFIFDNKGNKILIARTAINSEKPDDESFSDKICKKIEQGYVIERTKIRYIVKAWVESLGSLTTQILCEIHFKKESP